MPIIEPQTGFDTIQLNGSIRAPNINLLFDHMNGAPSINGLWNTDSGSVVASVVTPIALHPGIFQLQSGGAPGGTQISGAGNAFIVPSAFYNQYWLARVPTLSAGAQLYVARLGLCVTAVAPSEPTNGCYFVYDSSTSLNWLARTAKASVRTTVDTGVPVVAGQWYQLQVKGFGIAAPAQFFIDGVAVATIATNLPTVNLNHLAMIEKTLGATNILLFLDYFAFQFAFNVAR